MKNIKNIKNIAILAILVTGLIHAFESPEYFDIAQYLGWSFVLNAVGSFIAAYLIYKNKKGGWYLGMVIATFSIIFFIVSRSIGLPSFTSAIGDWPEGILPILIEGIFVYTFFKQKAF